jgi:radical SAM protein with 4Fe4S-binding SPASM domain
VETDLIENNAEALSRVDVVSVNLPAITPQTYAAMMGVDAYGRVIENLKRLISKRRGTPIIVPTFVKCRENLAEMEQWYDYWLRAIGAAVITAPRDADRACADMTPPKRRPCFRIDSRMTILSDGTVASCEQDVRGAQTVGNIHEESISEIWQNRFEPLRADHVHHRFENRPLCANCIHWHRP